MYKNQNDAIKFIKKFKPLVKKARAEIVIAAPFTLLPVLEKQLIKSNIKLAAQNLFYEKEGAFTGEISARMIKDFADYVIVGHSERRKYFHEDNELINKKIKAALDEKLKVIFCLGESFDERNLAVTFDVVHKQLAEGLDGISSENLKNIIIAYEPVWAIGTGRNATPAQAEEVHFFLKQELKKIFGTDTRIIYGGSVTSENAASILKMPNVDGCLPGGSSLDTVKLAKIIKSF